MNLLGKNNQMDEKSKIRAEILDILNDVNLDKENMKIAVEFFDFDKEINLGLLDNVTPQDAHFSGYFDAGIIKRLFDPTSKFDSEYIDRYILFIDAVYGVEAYHIMSNGYGYNFKYKVQTGNYDKKIIQALSRRFSVDDSWSKIFAMVMLSEDKYIYIYNSLSDYFTSLHGINSAKNLINAGRKCNSISQYAELKLYAAALQIIEPDDVNHDEELAESVKFALEKIFMNLNVDYKNNRDRFRVIMAVGFIASRFSNPIELRMKQKIVGYEIKALEAILSVFDGGYINANISRLYSIMDIDKDNKLTKQYIETAVACAFIDIKLGASDFLTNISVTHPKEFIEVMLSDKSISSRNNSYYNNYEICCFLPEMWRIIFVQNNEAVKEAGIVYKDALLDCTIRVLQKKSKIAEDTIADYLFRRRNLDSLEPYFDSLSDDDNFSMIFFKTRDLIEECINCNPEFKKRYYTLIALARPTELANIMNKERDSEIESRIQKRICILRDIIMAFAEEKLPEEYRFKAYDAMLNYNFGEDEIERYIKKIAKFMIGEPEKYNFCKKLGIISRKIYLKYLELNNENNKYKNEIFEMCADSSKEIRNLVIPIIAQNKDNESEVLKMLKAKKGAMRETALAILELWGSENYRDILLEMSETEKIAKIIDKIHSMLASGVSGSSKGENAISTSSFVENIHRGGRNRKILWLFQTPNSVVHFNNGAIADDKYLQAILLCYSGMTTFGISQDANMLAEDLNKTEFENFALEIFLKWIQDGAESKKKWVLYFSGIHGGFNIIEILQKYIKEWSEASRGAIAAEAVMALALNGSSDALMAVDNMAHKFKHKQVKSAANKALQNVADVLGITSDELGDRIVPNLGFDENMERIFDYGTRKFKVYLNTALEIEVYDEKNKKLKTIPAVGAKDTEDIAKASNAEFKQMKKQLKNVVAIQKLRLETAMLADRRWDVTAWENLFVKNPVMHKFAMGLIWTAYENNEAVQTFRYMEDGTFNTSDEDEYELPENCTIGLAHPIDLDEETLSAWKEQLSDYEIVQPIEQLEKKIYAVTDEEKGKLDLTRFNGRKINGYSLLGKMTKMGWYKGSVQDAGCFFTFYREDITKRTDMGNGVVNLEGNSVELQFSGMYVGGEDDNVEIETVRFYKPGTIARGSYVYDKAEDEKSIKLDRVMPRYFSEIVSQLEAILKTSEE